jgi:hypothetical protein
MDAGLHEKAGVATPLLIGREAFVLVDRWMLSLMTRKP